MFPGGPNPLSFTRILSGISKSLNIANQIIPIYQQVSPMIKNARSAFGMLKEINAPAASKKVINHEKTPNTNTTKKITNSSNFNSPSFFQ